MTKSSVLVLATVVALGALGCAEGAQTEGFAFDAGARSDTRAADTSTPVDSGSSDDTSDTAMSESDAPDSTSVVDSTSAIDSSAPDTTPPIDSTAPDTTVAIDSSPTDSKPAIDATPMDGGTTTWATNATAHDCTVPGSHFVYNCPPAGSAGVTRGTGVYSADSSVCTAAVHAGRITFATGGPIEIEIRTGLSSYKASIRNDLYSNVGSATTCAFAVVGPACANTSQADCGDLCADLTSDKFACGSCTTSCTSPLKCLSSVCK